MNEKTHVALKGSVEKWYNILHADGEDESGANCPLCLMFGGDQGGNCKECPVHKKVGAKHCGGTPWMEWVRHHNDFHDLHPRKIYCDECRKWAQAEYDFLKDLYIEALEATPAKKQTVYECPRCYNVIPTETLMNQHLDVYRCPKCQRESPWRDWDVIEYDYNKGKLKPGKDWNYRVTCPHCSHEAMIGTVLDICQGKIQCRACKEWNEEKLWDRRYEKKSAGKKKEEWRVTIQISNKEDVILLSDEDLEHNDPVYLAVDGKVRKWDETPLPGGGGLKGIFGYVKTRVEKKEEWEDITDECRVASGWRGLSIVYEDEQDFVSTIYKQPNTDELYIDMHGTGYKLDWDNNFRILKKRG